MNNTSKNYSSANSTIEREFDQNSRPSSCWQEENQHSYLGLAKIPRYIYKYNYCICKWDLQKYKDTSTNTNMVSSANTTVGCCIFLSIESEFDVKGAKSQGEFGGLASFQCNCKIIHHRIYSAQNIY